MTTSRERMGLLFAGLCALNGAFVPGLAKLTTNQADPIFVAAATTAFGGLFAACVLAARGELALLARPLLRGRLALIGFLGTAVAFLLYYEGTRRAGAIAASLCVQVEPAYSLFLTWLALGHRPTRRRVVSTVVLLAGIGLAMGAGGLTTSAGVWLLLATPLCWQLSHLVVLRGLPGVDPMVLTGARYVWGGIFLVTTWLVRGGLGSLPPRGELLTLLPILAGQGILLAYMGTAFWYQSIARLDLARATSIVVPSIPLLSFGASWLLVGEVATPRQWAGLLLTLAGVVAFVTAPDVKLGPPAAEPATSPRSTRS